MSAREEPATVPPPAGEEDAYSAATKVGVMPAEVMAKLRAEGLLPNEVEEAQPRSSTDPTARPPAARSASADPVSGLRSPPHPAPLSGSLPVVVSSDPPIEEGGHPGLEAITSLGPPPEIPLDGLTPELAEEAKPARDSRRVETPVAFASPEGAAADEPAEVAKEKPQPNQELRAPGDIRGSRSLVRALLVAGMLVAVVFAFVMALLSEHR